MLSAVIVTWNSARDITACLDSIHSTRRFEVIVVDNNSTDETRALLGSYHHLVTTLNPDNPGYARANNQGFARARGDYVLILNPDTRIEPGAIDLLVDHLDANPDHGAVAPRLVDYDDPDTTQHSIRAFPTAGSVVWDLVGLSRLFPRSRVFGALRMMWFDYDRPGPAPQPMTSCLLVRRSMLEDLRGMDESFPMFYNDVDLSRRMWDLGSKTWYLPAARVRHRRGASTGRVKPKMIRAAHRSQLHYLRKHDPHACFFLLVPLSGIVASLRVLWYRLGRRRRRRHSAR